MIVKFAWLAAAVMAIGAPASAALAPVDYQLIQSYDIVSPFDLHHGISYNTYATGSGTTNSYNLSAPGGTATDFFPKDPANPPLLTYIMFTSDLADEVDTEESDLDGHLVIAFNDAFAAALLADPQDFSVTFGGYDESSLISALTLLDTPDLDASDPGYAAQQLAKENAYDLVGTFSATVTELGGLTEANGGSMTLLSYSTPSLAGTGVARLTPVPLASDVPEPATWALMVGGFGAIGIALRARRRTTVACG